MQTAVPHRVLDRLIMGLVLVALAAPITYIEVMHPSLQSLQNLVVPRTQQSATAPAKPTPKPAEPSKAPVVVAPVPAPAPAPVPAAKTATTTTLVHFRTQKTASSENLGDIPEGSTVTLRDGGDATWQAVTYQGKDGFIYSSYLKY